MIETKYNFIKMSKVIENQSYLQTLCIGLNLYNETHDHYVQIDQCNNKINLKIHKKQYRDEINVQIIKYQHEYEHKSKNKNCKKNIKKSRRTKKKNLTVVIWQQVLSVMQKRTVQLLTLEL